MSEQQELEMLRAFAKSKNYEFNGFKFQWSQQHPQEPTVQPEPIVTPELTIVEAVVAEAKPTRKKKTPVEPELPIEE